MIHAYGVVQAGLFSGVDTAFIALTFNTLTPGVNDRTHAQANIFLIASLSCNVLAAFGAVIGKQWISRAFRPVSGDDPRSRAHDHQLKLMARGKSHQQSYLQLLPVILQISILLFWIGITLYLWTQSRGSAIAALAFALFGTVLYFASLGASLKDPFSPYESSLSNILRKLFQNLKEILRSSQNGPSPAEHSQAPGKSPKPVKNEELTSLCIEWSLGEVSDDEIALEVARLFPSHFDFSLMQRMARGSISFLHLLIHFHRRISGISTIQSDSALTYVVAICHILLVLPPKNWKPQMFMSILHVLRDFKDSSRAHRILNSILAEVCMRNSEDLNIPHLPIEDVLFDGAFDEDFTAERNLPFIYLAIDLMDAKNLPKEDLNRSVEFLQRCTRNIPIRRATKLMYWILSGNDDPNGLGAVKSRWDAYSP